MKKLIVSLLCTSLFLAGCSNTTPASTTETPETPALLVNPDVNEVSGGNYTDEMKIPYTVDLEEWGADYVERLGDHQGSPYFNTLDFYNMESNDTLSIISKFKTQQQTSEWSCGLSSALMVMEHFGVRGDHDEESLAMMRSNGMDYAGTTLADVVNILETAGGFDVLSTHDFEDEDLWDFMTLETIEETVAGGTPILIAWNDWGGHWQTIIGYDNMGTEYQGDDVIIVADSYDTTDHNQDGYGVYSAERFYYNWTMFDWFETYFGIDDREMLFAIPTLPTAE